MPDDQDDTESMPYSLYGDPSDPFSQLSSSRALAMSPRNRRRPVRMQGGGVTDPNDPNYGLTDESTPGAWANVPGIAGMDQSQIPLMPATERAQTLAQNPELTKDVQPAGWRTALGLAAQWFTRRHPGLGAAAANAITSTDPNVKAHQELLNQYAIANQQAQAERQNLGTLGMLGYRNELAKNRALMTAENIAKGQQAAGAAPIPQVTSPAPPVPSASAQAPSITGVSAPNVNQPTQPVPDLPPVVSPGAQVTPPAVQSAMTANQQPMSGRIGTYRQVRDPFTGQALQEPPPEDLKNTEFVTPEMAKAAGREELAGQRVTPAMWNSLNTSAEKNTVGVEAPLTPQRHSQFNELLSLRWQTLNPGKPVPAAFQLPPNATLKDYQEIEKSLNATESATATQTTREQNAGFRQQSLDLQKQARADAEESKADRQTKEGRKAVMGIEPGTGRSVMVPASQAEKLGIQDAMDMPSADVTKAQSARHWLPLATATGKNPEDMGALQLVDELDKRGALGPIASRWNDFMVGKLGTGTGDPETDRLIEALRAKMNLSNTLLMNVHVGSRGGSYMLEHFEDLANQKKMNPNILRTGIKSEVNYVEGRAMMPSNDPYWKAKSAPSPSPAPGGGGSDMINVMIPTPDGKGRIGPIHATQKDRFLADHPGSKVVP